MNNEKLYSANEVCEELNITTWTLSGWYRWEKKRIENGDITETRLPEPIRLENQKGKPRRWTEEMIEQLKEFKKGIVIGRNGIYGAYTNPVHTQTKKYKKSLETVDSE